MKNTNNSNIGFVVAIALAAVIFLLLKLSGSSFAGAFLLIGVIGLVIFLLIVILLTVFAIGLGKKDYEKKSAFSVSGEIPAEIRQAKDKLLSIHRLMRDLTRTKARIKAQETYDLCEKIVDTLEKQPDEVSRCRQFFDYYQPTFQTVLEKYLVLEAADVEADQAEEKLLSCLDQMNSALDKQYRNLFTNEMLDLTVETKALETIIKKDGLA